MIFLTKMLLNIFVSDPRVVILFFLFSPLVFFLFVSKLHQNYLTLLPDELTVLENLQEL